MKRTHLLSLFLLFSLAIYRLKVPVSNMCQFFGWLFGVLLLPAELVLYFLVFKSVLNRRFKDYYLLNQPVVGLISIKHTVVLGVRMGCGLYFIHCPDRIFIFSNSEHFVCNLLILDPACYIDLHGIQAMAQIMLIFFVCVG